MKNYFKFRSYKKDTIVFFDDEDKDDIAAVFTKIEAMNVRNAEVSVWTVPETPGPWTKLRAINGDPI